MSDLVSIIIPTFNRADLIGETLDSIIAQTYTQWEAIVVDDRSTDTTDVLLAQYTTSDTRIQYVKRPLEFPKGGNVCRNIGITKAKGSYIIFFDSDDLMTPDHIATKLSGFKNNDVDFVITKTKYFNKPKHKKDHNYHLDSRTISVNNYLAQRINWLTLDTCIKARVLDNIRFNETLKAGQEFNFYAKLLTQTVQCTFIPKVVSLRRHHETSIQATLRGSKQKRVSSFLSKWNTYTDLTSVLNSKEKKTILYACIKQAIKLKGVPQGLSGVMLLETFKVYGLAGSYFIGLLVLMPFGKGYFFHERLRRLSVQ